MNLKAALAALKKIENQFPKAFSEVDVDFSEILQ
jgi:hypothetical protein